MSDRDYELLVIGSGPAGHRAAIQAAKLGKKTAVVERQAVVGGACINTGTIPSKTLREAVLHLSGYRERNIYGASYRVKKDISMADLLVRTDNVIAHELDVNRHQLQRNGVELLQAEAAFVDPHTLSLADLDGRGNWDVTADRIVIAVGTTTTRESHVEFDGQGIFTSDQILNLKSLPRSLIVIGAGVIGLEYATIFAALGIRVTVVDKRPRLLSFIDFEIIDTLVYQMRQNRTQPTLFGERNEICRRIGWGKADGKLKDRRQPPGYRRASAAVRRQAMRSCAASRHGTCRLRRATARPGCAGLRDRRRAGGRSSLAATGSNKTVG